MTVKRMDNVGIVVEDLDAAITFFTELGLELEGRAPIEGRWAGGVTGLHDMRVEIAMMRTPDGHSRVEISRFLAPPVPPITAGPRPAPSATFASCSPWKTSTRRSAGCTNVALRSSARCSSMELVSVLLHPAPPRAFSSGSRRSWGRRLHHERTPVMTSYLRIAFVAAIGVAVTPPLVAQSVASLRGTVTDSITGAPVVGARVAARCTGCSGRQPTDSAGHYRLDRLPTGHVKFEVHCPSATGIGAEITNGVIDLSSGGETIVDVRVPPGQCTEPAYSERRGVFRGYWTPGFESSAFVPCADSALGVSAPLLPGKRLYPSRAWATVSASAAPSAVWPPVAPVDSYGNPTYFVVWRGVMKGPGSYGHMGVSDFAIGVDSILSMSAHGPADCRTR